MTCMTFITYIDPCQLETQACRQEQQGLKISYKGECAPKLGKTNQPYT